MVYWYICKSWSVTVHIKGVNTQPRHMMTCHERGRLIYFPDSISHSPEDLVHSGSVQTRWSGFLKFLLPPHEFGLDLALFEMSACIYAVFLLKSRSVSLRWTPIKVQKHYHKLITTNGTAGSLNTEYFHFCVWCVVTTSCSWKRKHVGLRKKKRKTTWNRKQKNCPGWKSVRLLHSSLCEPRRSCKRAVIQRGCCAACSNLVLCDQWIINVSSWPFAWPVLLCWAELPSERLWSQVVTHWQTG